MRILSTELSQLKRIAIVNAISNCVCKRLPLSVLHLEIEHPSPRPARAVVGPQDKQVITHYRPPTLLTIAQ